MRCEDVQESLLTDYIDGRLGEAGRKDIDDHVALCGACRDVLLAVCAAERALRSPLKEGPPPLVWENIRERIEARPVAFWGTFWKPTGIFAASLAVAFFIVGLQGPQGAGQKQAVLSGVEEAALLSYLVDYENRWDIQDKAYKSVVEDLFEPTGIFSG